MGLLENMNVCKRLMSFLFSFCHRALIYRVFVLLRKINFRDPRKLHEEIKTRAKCVIRSKIVGRRRRIPVMPASLDDFLLWSDPELCTLETLLERGMSLYCLTPDFAVFVRAPSDKNLYSSETSPFFYMAQFDHAEEVYITSHQWFHVLTSELTEVFRVPVTWLSNTGRCGSTLVCQMMERIPRAVCISEPDAIIHVADMMRGSSVTPDQSLQLLRSAILILLHHATTTSSQEHFGHVLIKPRSECTGLIREINKVCPQIRHVFMHRRFPVILQSYRELIERLFLPAVLVVDSDRIAAWKPNIRLSFFHIILFGRAQDREALEDLVPKLSFLGIAAAYIGSPVKMIQELQAEGFPIPALLYEDILTSPVSTVGSLLDHLQVSRDHLDAVLSAMSQESQRSVPFMVGKKKSSRRPLTDREQQDVNAVLDRIQLQTVDDVVEFRLRVDHQ